MQASLITLHWLYACILGVLGLTMGSFLNVVAYRVPAGVSILRPPSACPSCGTRIASRDNVPLLGWILLGGKCRACRTPISLRYPLVELATGLLWAATGWRLAGLQYGFWSNLFLGLLALAFMSSLVVTFLIDWDYQIILDEVSLGGLAAALAASAFLPMLHHADHPFKFAYYHGVMALVTGEWPAWLRSLTASAVGAAAGFLFSMVIYYGATMAFRRQIEKAREEDPEIDSALGLGDVKLMAFYGALFGWVAVFFIYVAGSIIGTVAGSVMKYRSGDSGGLAGWAGFVARWRSGDSVVPFGPFLTMGAALYFFLGDRVLRLLIAG